MKVSDGSKVKMHQSPACEVRDRLSLECSILLGEWLRCKDEAGVASKKDRSYASKLKQMKEAHRRLKAANERLSQHALREHGCW